MANKIDTCVSGLATALGGLVEARGDGMGRDGLGRDGLVEAGGAGVLKSVQTELINPLTAPNPPVIALVCSRLQRSSVNWTAEVLIQLRCDEDLIDVVADVDDKITAFRTGGSAGGLVDRPMWDFWYAPGPGGGLRKVGAIAGLRITVKDPLKTA